MLSDLAKMLPLLSLVVGGVMNKNKILGPLTQVTQFASVAVTQQEVNDLTKMVQLDLLSGVNVDPSRFRDYCQKYLLVKEGIHRDTSRDRWGTELRLVIVSDRVRVQSAGPDKVFGNDDDISSSLTLSQ